MDRDLDRMPPPTQIAPTAPVLVLDGDQPSALAIVRALGRHGITVHVASSVGSPLAGYSRHAVAVARYPDPLRDSDGFTEWLRARQKSRPDELIIPVTERTVVPLMRQRHSLDDSCIAMASSAALEQVLVKDRTVLLAESLGVPVPRSVRVSAPEQLTAAAQRLGYPLVIKPARSVGQDGSSHVQLSVSYALTPAELMDKAGQALRFGEVVLQEFFRGEGVGVEVIVDHGTVRYAFQHRRLHEVPLTGGGSSLRISEPVLPALRAASEQLLQAIGWHGVAMVEFKHEPTSGEFRLVEINGRFWGSLPLAVAAGADFPTMLYELMTTGKVGDHPPPRSGIVGRLLSRDLLWLEHVVRQSGPRGLGPLPTRGQALRDSLGILSPRHRFDVQSWHDPWPGLVDLGRIATQQWRRVTDALHRRKQLHRAWRAARAAQSGMQQRSGTQRVLFVCYGNINRSAVAHVHGMAQHGGRWQILSAGFHAVEDRPADPTMISVASARGVNLSGWHSHALTDADIDNADLILAMELSHLDRLAQQYPASAGKSYLLAGPTASRAAEVEVPDPYGRTHTAYDLACSRVIGAVDKWLGPTRPLPPANTAH
jgi:protein-tyrosine-phosphatase/carbamoylphosphate synthase large subunit